MDAEFEKWKEKQREEHAFKTWQINQQKEHVRKNAEYSHKLKAEADKPHWARKGKAALHAAGDAISMGLQDELGGMVAGAYEKAKGNDYLPTYRGVRDQIRATNKEMQEKEPITYGAANIGASLVPGMALYKAAGSPQTLTGNVALGAGEGTISTAGRSDDMRDFVDNRLFDIPISAGIGGLGYLGAEYFKRFKDSGKPSDIPNRQRQLDDTGLEYKTSILKDIKSPEQVSKRNIDTLTELAARKIGVSGNRVTSEKLDKASSTLKEEYDNTLDNYGDMYYDNAFKRDLKDALKEHIDLPGTKKGDRVVSDMLKKVKKNDKLTPRQYKAYRSHLGKLSATKTGKKNLYGNVKSKLDDLVISEKPDLFNELKKHDDKLKIISMLKKGKVVNRGTGKVNIQPFINQVQKQKDKFGIDKDINDAALAADAFDLAGLDQESKGGLSGLIYTLFGGPINPRVVVRGRVGGDKQRLVTGSGGKLSPAVPAIQALIEHLRRQVSESAKIESYR